MRQPTLQRAWSSNKAPRDGIDAHVAGGHLSGKRVPHFISEIGAGRQTRQQIDRPPLEPAAKRRIAAPEWKNQICFRESPPIPGALVSMGQRSTRAYSETSSGSWVKLTYATFK